MMCRQVVDAMTDAEEGALTGLRAWAYRLHMKVCPSCRAHREQLHTAVDCLKAMPREKPSEDAKEQALRAFRERSKKTP